MFTMKTLSALPILAGLLVGLTLQLPTAKAQPPGVGEGEFADITLEVPEAETKAGGGGPCSYVDVEETCYDWNEDDYIKMSTKNCSPYGTDWIGLYKDTGRREYGYNRGKAYWDKRKNYDWEYVCGTKTCTQPRKYKTNYFTSWWKNLSSGEYKVYLFYKNSYFVKAESDTFTVEKKDYCDDGTHHPTYYPTEHPTYHPTEEETCEDVKGKFRLQRKGKYMRGCNWASKKKSRCNWRLYKSYKRVRYNCPRTCGECPETDSPTESPTDAPSESPTTSSPTVSNYPSAGPTF